MSLIVDTPRRHAITPREKEILCALAVGLVDKQVALKLGIALGSVRTYRKRIQTKLGTKGLAQSLLVAWRLGMIDLEAIADELVANLRESNALDEKGSRGRHAD